VQQHLLVQLQVCTACWLLLLSTLPVQQGQGLEMPWGHQLPRLTQQRPVQQQQQQQQGRVAVLACCYVHLLLQQAPRGMLKLFQKQAVQHLRQLQAIDMRRDRQAQPWQQLMLRWLPQRQGRVDTAGPCLL
jgi:hypothetical protein